LSTRGRSSGLMGVLVVEGEIPDFEILVVLSRGSYQSLGKMSKGGNFEPFELLLVVCAICLFLEELALISALLLILCSYLVVDIWLVVLSPYFASS
jgi:hypothetical protein